MSCFVCRCEFLEPSRKSCRFFTQHNRMKIEMFLWAWSSAYVLPGQWSWLNSVRDSLTLFEFPLVSVQVEWDSFLKTLNGEYAQSEWAHQKPPKPQDMESHQMALIFFCNFCFQFSFTHSIKTSRIGSHSRRCCRMINVSKQLITLQGKILGSLFFL